jgi:hypothetical protein
MFHFGTSSDGVARTEGKLCGGVASRRFVAAVAENLSPSDQAICQPVTAK